MFNLFFSDSFRSVKDVWPASPPQAVRRVGPDPPRALLLPSLLLFLLCLLLLRRSGGSVLTRLGLGATMVISRCAYHRVRNRENLQGEDFFGVKDYLEGICLKSSPCKIPRKTVEKIRKN